MTDAERDARVQAAANVMRDIRDVGGEVVPGDAGDVVAAADAAAPGGGVVSRAEVAELIGDEQHPGWADYLATNLLELLRAAPDTGDWHGVLRAWCERQSSGKIEPNRPGGGVVSRVDRAGNDARRVADREAEQPVHFRLGPLSTRPVVRGMLNTPRGEAVARAERAEAEVERLREARDAHEQDATMCHEVATDLRRERDELRAEVERLREALREVVEQQNSKGECTCGTPGGYHDPDNCLWGSVFLDADEKMREIARAALANTKPEGDEG
jgi:hypothetical protein